jgi:uncharacterized protein
MTLPDASILIYAYDADSPYHSQCRQWVDSMLAGDDVYGMSPQVLSSAIRITTNRRAFANPQPLDRVLEFCNKLLDQPHCQVILPGPRHWRIFCGLCVQADGRGDLVSDAWFAALAIEHGCEWITFDRDFARFARLRWRTPF